MSVSYQLPETEDIVALAAPREFAITVYAETSPMVGEREASFARVKSGFDAGFDELKQADAPFAVRERLRAQWDALAADDALWGNLAASAAVFLDPDETRVFVLPNRLETQRQAGRYFDLGQLFRARTFPQRAHALLVSANEWSLWIATATDRARRVEVAGHHPANVDEATNRDVENGHQDIVRRLIGEEGRKVLLGTYAKRVAEAVAGELNGREERRDEPVFLFATEPLLSMVSARGVGEHPLVSVPGAPDRLDAAEIDRAVRERLRARNAREVRRRVDAFSDAVSSGLIATQLSTIARAAAESAVDTLFFDFTVDVFGTFDPATGALELSADNGRALADGRPAYDVLSAIAVTVVERGGTVFAVRGEEIRSSLWNGEAIARLRFTLP